MKKHFFAILAIWVVSFSMNAQPGPQTAIELKDGTHVEGQWIAGGGDSLVLRCMKVDVGSKVVVTTKSPRQKVSGEILAITDSTLVLKCRKAGLPQTFYRFNISQTVVLLYSGREDKVIPCREIYSAGAATHDKISEGAVTGLLIGAGCGAAIGAGASSGHSVVSAPLVLGIFGGVIGLGVGLAAGANSGYKMSIIEGKQELLEDLNDEIVKWRKMKKFTPPEAPVISRNSNP